MVGITGEAGRRTSEGTTKHRSSMSGMVGPSSSSPKLSGATKKNETARAARNTRALVHMEFRPIPTYGCYSDTEGLPGTVRARPFLLPWPCAPGLPTLEPARLVGEWEGIFSSSFIQASPNNEDGQRSRGGTCISIRTRDSHSKKEVNLTRSIWPLHQAEHEIDYGAN